MPHVTGKEVPGIWTMQFYYYQLSAHAIVRLPAVQQVFVASAGCRNELKRY